MPMDTGGKIRTGNILKQLSKHHDITLVSNMESSKDDQYLYQIPQFCSKFIPVKWKEIRKYSSLFFLRLFVQMFSIHPVSALNDYSAKLRSVVEKELAHGKYDIAICDFVQSALLFKNVKKIPTLLFQHNVESVISQRHISQSKNSIARFFWWLQWKKMFSFEKKSCLSFKTVIAVSDNDNNLFKALYGAKNGKIIPTGVDLNYYCPSYNTKKIANHIVFCGSMDWLPNEDAVYYFVNEILPILKKEIPNIKFTVIGRNPSTNMIKLEEEIEELSLTGWVDDTRPFIEKGSVFVVPIRIGGGTRMKIYEAMAMGKAVVSTTIGAEGLPLEPGTHLMIENDPDKFANTIVQLIKDEALRDKLSKNAREYVEMNFGWQSVAEVFSKICESTVHNEEL